MCKSNFMPLSFGISRGTRKAEEFFGDLLNAPSIQTFSAHWEEIKVVDIEQPWT
jgi:hypothetical protein